MTIKNIDLDLESYLKKYDIDKEEIEKRISNQLENSIEILKKELKGKTLENIDTALSFYNYKYTKHEENSLYLILKDQYLFYKNHYLKKLNEKEIKILLKNIKQFLKKEIEDIKIEELYEKLFNENTILIKEKDKMREVLRGKKEEELVFLSKEMDNLKKNLFNFMYYTLKEGIYSEKGIESDVSCKKIIGRSYYELLYYLRFELSSKEVLFFSKIKQTMDKKEEGYEEFINKMKQTSEKYINLEYLQKRYFYDEIYYLIEFYYVLSENEEYKIQVEKKFEEKINLLSKLEKKSINNPEDKESKKYVEEVYKEIKDIQLFLSGKEE